jgi:hypothetical protein
VWAFHRVGRRAWTVPPGAISYAPAVGSTIRVSVTKSGRQTYLLQGLGGGLPRQELAGRPGGGVPGELQVGRLGGGRAPRADVGVPAEEGIEGERAA